MNGRAFLTGALLGALCFTASLGAFPAALKPVPRLLWSFSWETGKNAFNRGDIRLELPALDLSLRAQAIDRRPAEAGAFLPGAEAPGRIGGFGGGLYHLATGSRLLYGVLDEWGLPARLRGPWLRTAPFVENRQPQMADLKTEASATREPETYLYLALPRGGPLGAFGSLRLDGDFKVSAGGGLDFHTGGGREAGLEFFYAARDLPSSPGSAWFSRSPPLPERDFRFAALGFFYNGPFLGLGSDWGYSQTSSYGRDLYGSLGLRLGDKPWRVSLAADGAGDRYMGSGGSAAGGGFRLAARLERRESRGGLFRLSGVLRAPGLDGPFTRSSSQASYRFPAPPPRRAAALRLSRVSLTLNRNGADPAKTEDALDVLLGLKWGAWSAAFQGSLHLQSALEGRPQPFFFPGPETGFSSARISGELGYGRGILSATGKLGYTAAKNRDPVWNASLQGTIRGKPGRLSLKLALPDFSGPWSLTVSWRLEW